MTFAELLAHGGVREVCELRGRIGVMAFHGGSLEAATDVIAAEVAARAGASLYAVVQSADVPSHIPSHRILGEDSPALAAFLAHVDVAVSLHGYGRDGKWTTLLLGGGHRPLAEHLATHLRAALPDYTMETRIDAIPEELRGLHRSNPVNVPSGGGVQIELPPRVRGRSPLWAGWSGPGHVPHMQSLIDALTSALTSWPPPDPMGATTRQG